jgi:hypothetical protein
MMAAKFVLFCAFAVNALAASDSQPTSVSWEYDAPSDALEYPPYMVNNEGNQFGVAPDKGSPITVPAENIINMTSAATRYTVSTQAGSYWYADANIHGKVK